MDDHHFLFYALSLLATARGFNILEARNAHQQPQNYFFAVLGWVGAYQFNHFNTDGISQIAWFAYLFLGVSPVLAYILSELMDAISRIILFVLTVLLLCAIGFFLFPPLALGELAPAAFTLAFLLHLPYRRFFAWQKSIRQKREAFERGQEEESKRLREREEERQQQQEEQELMEKLIRDLAK